MWLVLPSSDSLTRPRIAVALVSAVAVSASYYAYRSYSDPALYGPGLHRSNAVRRGARRSRRASLASELSQPDENANVDTTQQAQDGDAVLEDWWNDPNAGVTPPARAGHNIVNLLFRVSEDNARRNACVHRGCACNACGVVPIRGVRYRCANCADFDLCETCEAQGMHYKTHVFYKIKIPAPPFGPRQMQPVWYAGDPESCIRTLPRLLIHKLSRETGFERPEIEAFWEQFTFMANSEWREDPDGLQLAMDKKTFERCLVPSGGSRHAMPNLIHDRMFSFYDTNNDDLIGFAEFLQGLAYRKRKDKLRRIFEGYDIDGDGYVNRRDFLRMFRAYYVLYKQMHRDILDGLDDQLMGSTEAQQLIAGRQPLSSLFGREGRVPNSDGNHRGEGKIFHANGDVELENNRAGAVLDDHGDTSSREDILTRLFAAPPPSSTAAFRAAVRRLGPSFAALAEPPSTVEELSSLLDGSRQIEYDEEALEFDRDVEMTSPEEEAEPANHSDAENRGDGVADTNDDGSRTIDPQRWTSAMPTESQLRAQVTARDRSSAPQMDADRRRAARQQLHQRWKRRQFYLDEEEGGVEPDDWAAEEDVLEHLNGVAESSKTANPMSPRSRSSSKVRFAEDMDDFDIRSNPSTSSRSVPERWGGFEIPEEERDAGREVLYQVTQQAFNELLDGIFKEVEDLAIRAAETKEQRDQNRDLFESIDIDPPAHADRPVAEKSLEELLETSGYSVDASLDPENNVGSVTVEETEEIEEEEYHEASETQPEDVRDPTLPQFRPNATETPLGLPANPEGDAPSDSARGKQAAKAHRVIPMSRLVEWKRLDRAERQAEERGGWGKLSYEEFEDIYKSQENSGNRLDYLGSWVDFCIP